METNAALGVLMQAALFVGLLILFAYVNEALFEALVAKLIFDPLVLKTGKEWFKKLQPLLVLVAAGLISIALGQPLTDILTKIVAIPELNNPLLATLANALLIGGVSFKAHDRAEKEELIKEQHQAQVETQEAFVEQTKEATAQQKAERLDDKNLVSPLIRTERFSQADEGETVKGG